MILTRDGKEITAIYRQDGSEVEEVKDATGRIVYSASREITGTLPLYFSGRGKPLTDYLIYGETMQDGTPSPDMPVDVVGCGVRTGNLFDKNATNVNNGYIKNGFLQSDGIITTNINYCVSEYIRIAQNQSYTLFYGSNLSFPSVCFYDSAKNYISGIAYAGRWSVPFTTPQNAEYLRLSFRAADPALIMLNTGSTPLPYEPYGYKLPPTVNGVEYPIYLGTVPTTRRIKKLVLTGEETWILSTGWKKPATSVFYSPLADVIHMSADYAIFICSNAFAATTRNELYNGDSDMVARTGKEALTIRISDGIAATVADLKSYLAAQYANGTPVTVWYVLATPETGIVNEPLMKIGDYADTISFAQADVTIPTVSGANAIDMTSAVKPSEVYIKGSGIKPTGYGNLTDKNGVYILDKNGVQITVHGQ